FVYFSEMFSFLGSSIGFSPILVTNWKESESTKNSKNGVCPSKMSKLYLKIGFSNSSLPVPESWEDGDLATTNPL
ncbi:hypothetical protein NDU88_004304, partial [Pleurodeles waltl]